MTSTAEVIKEFQNVTGADADTSKFYLESSGWDISAATEMFFESGGQPTVAPAGGSGQAVAGGHAPPATSAAPRPARSQPQRGGIRGFSDLGGDDAEEEGQDFYTGGKASGMVVRDPKAPPSGSSHDIVSELMENARKHGGAEAPPEQPAAAPSRPVFVGSGYRLGDETKPSEKIVPREDRAAAEREEKGPVTRSLVFYRQGFTVDGGPLRSYTDPANAEFLNDINKGIAPAELEREARGRPLSVNLMDKKSEDYVPPPKVITPFAGAGQRLGGPSSAPAPAATTASSAPRRPLVVDDTQPTTSVQIRLHDGTRLVAKFNHTHTVGDLRGFVDAALPKRVAYQLQTTLPVRVLADESQTLQEAGLLGSTVVQRPL